MIDEKQKSASEIQEKLDELQTKSEVLERDVRKYNEDPKWQLPELGMLMTANAYKTKVAEPLVRKLKGAIRSATIENIQTNDNLIRLRKRLNQKEESVEWLGEKVLEIKRENSKLLKIARDYRVVKKSLGNEKIEEILGEARAKEQIKKNVSRSRDYNER